MINNCIEGNKRYILFICEVYMKKVESMLYIIFLCITSYKMK